MAIDKAIDSAQLDAGLTSIADSIRAKGGTSDALAFPGGFVDAIGAIETGGGADNSDDSILASLIDRSIKSISLPSNITYVGTGAFNECRELTEITIPDSVTKIGGTAFGTCSFLKNVKLPASLIELMASAFVSCASLVSIEIPDSCATIGNYAFNGCTSLANVKLPASLKSVGAAAFNGNRSITSITFPPTVTSPSLATNSFGGCINLLDIYVPWSEGAVANAPWGATYATVHYNHTEEGA